MVSSVEMCDALNRFNDLVTIHDSGGESSIVTVLVEYLGLDPEAVEDLHEFIETMDVENEGDRSVFMSGVILGGMVVKEQEPI